MLKKLHVVLMPAKESHIIKCIDTPHNKWAKKTRNELVFNKGLTNGTDCWQPQHMYWIDRQSEITNDDWYVTIFREEVKLYQMDKINGDGQAIMREANKNPKTTYKHTHFKVIATTNPECNLPKIPQQDIEDYVAAPYETVDIKWIKSPEMTFGKTGDYTVPAMDAPELFGGYVSGVRQDNRYQNSEDWTLMAAHEIYMNGFREPDNMNYKEQCIDIAESIKKQYKAILEMEHHAAWEAALDFLEVPNSPSFREWQEQQKNK